MSTTYRTGAVGALMDEYERAADEFARIVESLSDDEYGLVWDTATEDEHCRSIQSILGHVVGAGYGYAGMLRDAWGIPRVRRGRVTIARADVPGELRAMLEYTCATLEGKWDLSDDEAIALQMRSGWGPVYDFEQLFEHAIVHVLRHRRQIERWLGR